MGVKRYEVDPDNVGMLMDTNGDYVLFTDYNECLSKLQSWFDEHWIVLTPEAKEQFKNITGAK